MHPEAKDFTIFVKQNFPEFFTNKKVLDVGSGDINGNNRFLFQNCTYEGNDITRAPNVTIVSKTSKLPFSDETFDTIVSTECFEHDPEYKLSFLKIFSMLKKGGLFFFTCAGIGRKEHGTRRSDPNCSYGTIAGIEEMSDYYMNLTELELNSVLNIRDNFDTFNCYYNSHSKDFYFYGIKKGGNKEYINKEYVNIYTTNTNKNI